MDVNRRRGTDAAVDNNPLTTGDANSTMTSLAQHAGQDAAESTVVYAASSSSVLAGETSPF
ncbi:MAG: hypothetical protein ACK58T_19070, partial [Phycisphaerae bacterium]